MHGTSHSWTPYCGVAPVPADWLQSWNGDPFLIMAMTAGLGLGLKLAPREKGTHLATFGVALILFVTPLCALGSALFTVRAIHHVALALILAPLLATSFDLKTRIGPSSLSLLTGIQAIVFWFWHAPPLYSAALSNSMVFWIMQLSLIGTAALWWASMRQAQAPAAVAATLATMVQMGALGALLTFAGRAFYAPHFATTQAWGWTPLEDQQIAGLIMWAPASAAYLLIALAILYRSMQPAYAR
ncbi:cytochrome c oxidase assembly protein [Qipengyuania spongiae]|uniref:Cytochrome c oxidase assembly protein n=1 Tax=Qipengyuania spongiae TaxID=2909673 RepID=A0ABY5SYL9_9SPHN|nr:cytochrome c oxidase assembly protein [Qipengyuania spongiae]UVI39623.1 cytochrome c oxidase assembly protein [Qipengyuania spongiae]